MTRLLPLLVLLALPAALAQRSPGGPSAADRYHEAAQFFIDGKTDEAAQAADAGLALAPTHQKLQELRDLIRQQEDPQQQSGGDQQQQRDQADQHQESDDGQPNEDGSGGSGPPPERPEDEQQAERDQTNAQPQPGEGDEKREPNRSGARPGQGGATPDGEAGAVPEGQMSRAQADRILDAVGGEERLLLREMRRAPSRVRRAEKDW